MGISGLIPFLENASKSVNMRDFQGSSVAVDSYCWLHKGVFACAEKLVRGEHTDVYLNYCMKFVEMLTSYNIKVIMVFDGRHLPAKAETERRRRESRQESKRLAKEYLRKNDMEKARSHMRRAVDVTHEMALRLIKSCRERGLECIVAPYEADAQMAWLNKKGLAEYIITEDSDLTLFGAHKILFKLDLQGNALLVENTKLHLAMGCKPEKYTFDKFRRMCILSGCDYLDSLPGIGLKKALKFILTTEEDDMKKALKKIPQYLKMKQLDVSDEYIDKFLKAEATFKYMYIYNPLERRMERLHDLDEFGTDEEYCSNAGTLLEDQEQALQLALGNLNPFTLEKLDDWHPDKIDWSNVSKKQKRSLKHVCIWGSTKCHSKKMESGEKSVGASLPFKKIEFKNMAEVEIQENLAEEKSKLEEAEIFSMYSYGQAHGKRKREPSDSEEGDETCVVEVSKTPSKTYNPFAINHNSSLDEKPKSPVCTSRSLLKLLSPHKNLEESTSTSRNIKESVDIKSRFFVQNVKQITKKTFAARDLSEEMTKLEEKSRNTSVIQKTLYYDLSPQSTKDEENNNKLITRNIEIFAEAPERNDNLKYENDLENTNNSIPHTASEEILEIVSDEDDRPEENVDEFPKFFQTSSQSLSSTQKHLGLSKPKKANSTSGKNSKSILNDSKQSTLSMFGFQKRPTLKKN